NGHVGFLPALGDHAEVFRADRVLFGLSAREQLDAPKRDSGRIPMAADAKGCEADQPIAIEDDNGSEPPSVAVTEHPPPRQKPGGRHRWPIAGAALQQRRPSSPVGRELLDVGDDLDGLPHAPPLAPCLLRRATTHPIPSFLIAY